MPINARTTTANYDDCTLRKEDAVRITVQVANQACRYQVNTDPLGGETWVPIGGIHLVPGLWTFDAPDWTEYGVQAVQGMRFIALNPADPAVITAN